MYPNPPVLKVLALSGVALLFTLAGARAWEADAVAGRLKEALAARGIGIEWAEAARSGGAIALSDVRIGVAGVRGKADVGDLTLDAVSEDADSYLIGNIVLPTYSASGDEGSVSVSGLSVAGLAVPKAQGEAPAILRYDTARLDGATVTDSEGRTLFMLAGLRSAMRPPADDGTLAFTGGVESFTLDLAAAAKTKQRQRLAAMGYAQVSGKADFAGSWRPSDGHLKLSRYGVAVDDAGTLRLKAELGGYTPEFAAVMGRLLREALLSDEADWTAKGLGALGLMQQLTFGGLTVRFDDDGLTGRALKAAAEERGVAPRDVANTVKALVPMKLEPYVGAGLAREAGEVVGTFLDDPRSIEISARPAAPLPFAAITMGAALGAPEMLRDQLGLEVTANR